MIELKKLDFFKIIFTTTSIIINRTISFRKHTRDNNYHSSTYRFPRIPDKLVAFSSHSKNTTRLVSSCVPISGNAFRISIPFSRGRRRRGSRAGDFRKGMYGRMWVAWPGAKYTSSFSLSLARPWIFYWPIMRGPPFFVLFDAPLITTRARVYFGILPQVGRARDRIMVFLSAPRCLRDCFFANVNWGGGGGGGGGGIARG